MLISSPYIPIDLWTFHNVLVLFICIYINLITSISFVHLPSQLTISNLKLYTPAAAGVLASRAATSRRRAETVNEIYLRFDAQ
jgi:hypothetical protein